MKKFCKQNVKIIISKCKLVGRAANNVKFHRMSDCKKKKRRVVVWDDGTQDQSEDSVVCIFF